MAHIVIVWSRSRWRSLRLMSLRKKLGKEHRVTLIGSVAYFEFTPSNPWIAVGWRTPKRRASNCRSRSKQGH